MIGDANSLAQGATLTADVCIVGAGAAGITLARELRGSGMSVLLLESGGFDPEPETQDLYKGRQSGIDTWDLDAMRARQFGGSTWLWAGWCRPLSPEDFEPRSWVPGGGWPIRYDDLLPYYRRAHATVEIGGFDYDAAAHAAKSGLPLLPFDGVIETRMYQYSTTRFGLRYRDDLAAASDVDVRLHANLVAIRLTGPGGRISHLECATLSGVRFRAEAHRYVLALGGIENARMLLASNAESREGVANGTGLVGRFMEHPHFYDAIALLFGDAPDLRFYEQHDAEIPRDGESRTVPIRGALGLTTKARAEAQVPTFLATLDVFDLDSPTGPIRAADARTMLGPGARPSVVRLTCRSEQTASDDSRITLMDERDALGVPRVDLHWSIAPEDRVAMERSCTLLGRELGRLGLGRVWTPPADFESGWIASPGGHHLGTTRMSADPSMGVVDANLRAHEVDNLHIAGCSTFATGGDANPTLTIVALAHRLADHLKETA